jgi:hypothetical protein
MWILRLLLLTFFCHASSLRGRKRSWLEATLPIPSVALSALVHLPRGECLKKWDDSALSINETQKSQRERDSTVVRKVSCTLQMDLMLRQLSMIAREEHFVQILDKSGL